MKRGILLTMLILMLLSPPFVVGQEHASSDAANQSACGECRLRLK